MPTDFVKNWARNRAGSVASITTPPMATTAGNALVVGISAFSNVIGSTPITDSVGETWQAAIPSQGTTEGFGAIYYAENIIGGGAQTITFTPSSNEFIAIAAIEIQHVKASGIIGQTNWSADTGTTKNSGNVTAGIDPSLAIGVGALSRSAGTNYDQQIGFPTTPWLWTGMAVSASTQGITLGCRLLDPSETTAYIYTSHTNISFAGIVLVKLDVVPVGGGGEVVTVIG